jgi:hypothetical protein
MSSPPVANRFGVTASIEDGLAVLSFAYQPPAVPGREPRGPVVVSTQALPLPVVRGLRAALEELEVRLAQHEVTTRPTGGH